MCGFTISDEDDWIPFLYGKSGNRCAICRTSLFSSSSTGEESERFEHIIDNSINDPQNLILLCEKCRGVVKIWPELYTPKVLASIKENHESMVANILSNN